jgi:hypothetical protein
VMVLIQALNVMFTKPSAISFQQPVSSRFESEPTATLLHRGKKYRVIDVMMMLASAIGNMTFQPNRIN